MWAEARFVAVILAILAPMAVMIGIWMSAGWHLTNAELVNLALMMTFAMFFCGAVTAVATGAATGPRAVIFPNLLGALLAVWGVASAWKTLFSGTRDTPPTLIGLVAVVIIAAAAWQRRSIQRY